MAGRQLSCPHYALVLRPPSALAVSPQVLIEQSLAVMVALGRQSARKPLEISNEAEREAYNRLYLTTPWCCAPLGVGRVAASADRAVAARLEGGRVRGGEGRGRQLRHCLQHGELRCPGRTHR